MKTLIAAGIGVMAMGVTSALAFVYTKRKDPSLVSLVRTSQIAAVLVVALGIYVGMKKNALWGAAIATGGASLVLGAKVAALVGGALDKPAQNQQAAVFGNMGAYRRQMAAVFGNMGAYRRQMEAYRPQMGAVFGNMGRLPGQKPYVPAPPWTGNPF